MSPTLLVLPIFLIASQSDRLAVDISRPVSVDFARDVLPVFKKHCHQCHGPAKQKSGLRLDVKAKALEGGDVHGPSIVPGKAADSPLIQLVSGANKDLRMPPKGDRLSAAEIATLTNWINRGASWPDGAGPEQPGERQNHWSFKPLTDPAAPDSTNKSWPRNEIDAFILARLEKEGLRPRRRWTGPPGCVD